MKPLVILALVAASYAQVAIEGAVSSFMVPEIETYNPTKALGESCETGKDCMTAFSDCIRGKCNCMEGFQVAGQECRAEDYACPTGEPLTNSNGDVRKCEMTISYSQRGGNIGIVGRGRRKRGGGLASSAMILPAKREIQDNCGEGAYCLTYQQGFQNGTGHCCPLANRNCPVGNPHPTRKCPNFMNTPPNRFEMCDQTTHFCYHSNMGGQFDQEALCCPRACSMQGIYKNNRCYGRVKVDEECEIKEQCPHSATCVSGTCQCNEGSISRNGYCMVPSCPNFGIVLNSEPALLSSARPSPMTQNRPKTDSDGQVIECEASDECGSGFYCLAGTRVCCKTPEARCPNGQRPGSVRSCNPRDRNACEANEFCHSFYYSVESQAAQASGQADGGASLCCPQNLPRPVPMPQPIGK